MNIGEPVKEVEFEPIEAPREIPVSEPVPVTVPEEEPVPAGV